MILMPSNNTGYIVKDLFKKYPGQIALMQNPNRISKTSFQYPYAIDNAAFKKFNANKFFKMLDYSKQFKPPIFVVCPDVVGCHDRTLALWHYYYPIIAKYDYPIAFVAQDGCEPALIPNNADWIFIGGNDPWKMDNLYKFTDLGKPVHVGRVNSIGRVQYCQSLGVRSVDGTGWMRSRDQKFHDMLNWFSGKNEQLCLF